MGGLSSFRFRIRRVSVHRVTHASDTRPSYTLVFVTCSSRFPRNACVVCVLTVVVERHIALANAALLAAPEPPVVHAPPGALPLQARPVA
eukprot:1191716-Prorocentrum_minimum.AAC.2